MRNLTLLCIVFNVAASAIADETPKPKYGPASAPLAVPLSRDNAYFRKSAQKAPDFWALIPYYTAQRNELSCSAASVAMVVNAARVSVPLNAEDKLATQSDLIEKVGNEKWAQRVNPEGAVAEKGLTLEQLATVLKASLNAYQVEPAAVEVIRFAESREKNLSALRRILAENEKSARDFLVINFLQKAFTDDAAVGHIAPLAAYDAKSDRVLILDPDREWYEPYWVSVPTLLEGMTAKDKSNGDKPRGLVRVGFGK